jgi:hypothetical protein
MNKNVDRSVFDGDMSYDVEILDIILERKPKTILEFGAGKSTKELRKISKVVTIDDEKRWKPNIYSELKNGTFDLDGVELPKTDMVLIDAPSILKGAVRENLMAYKDQMHKEAVYIVDDTHRPSERNLAEAIAEWKQTPVVYVKTRLKEFAVIG